MFQKTVDTIAFPFDRYGTVTEFRDGEEREWSIWEYGQGLSA